MDSKKKNKEDIYAKKIGKFLVTIFSGLMQKFSINLLINAKKQIDELISQIKRGILAGFFMIIGLFFLLIGLGSYLEAVFNFTAGGGYLIIGIFGIFLAFLIAILKK